MSHIDRSILGGVKVIVPYEPKPILFVLRDLHMKIAAHPSHVIAFQKVDLLWACDSHLVGSSHHTWILPHLYLSLAVSLSLPLTLSFSISLSLTLSLPRSFTLSLSFGHFPFLPHSLYLSPSPSYSLSLSLFFSLQRSQSLHHSLYHFLSLSHSLSHSPTLSITLSLTLSIPSNLFRVLSLSHHLSFTVPFYIFSVSVSSLSLIPLSSLTPLSLYLL